MNLQQARRSFPGLRDKVFLDAACVSLVPEQARAAIESFLDMTVCYPATDASEHHIQMDIMRQQAVDQAARLLNAPPDSIALIESTTHGLNVAANAIPLRPGDNVLIAFTEFLQVAIPWYRKRETDGIEIRPVLGADRGELSLEDFERAMDANTRAVCVSSVQWCSGYRLDMKALGELCRSRGVWLVVDAIQEMGALSIDVETRIADFLIAGGHKWLNAPFGCGVMQLSERALDELEPDSYGYLALEEPEGGWGEYFRTPTITPFRDYSFPAEAKTFETAGTANYPGAIGLAASLRLVNAVGIEEVDRQVTHLSGLLHAELTGAGICMVSQEDPCLRSGITIFNVFENPRENQALVERILKEKIYISIRYTSGIGGIRASTHFYNDEEDVMKLVWAVKEAMSSPT